MARLVGDEGVEGEDVKTLRGRAGEESIHRHCSDYCSPFPDLAIAISQTLARIQP
jgi:hypothetical protein